MKIINVKIACSVEPPLSKDFIWCHKNTEGETVYQIWTNSGYQDIDLGDLEEILQNKNKKFSPLFEDKEPNVTEITETI